MHTLTLAHSPDSDDLVMWWPLTDPPPGGREPPVRVQGVRFQRIARDIQILNTEAIGAAPYDLTAVSAATYPRVADRYRITAAGASFGQGYGPKVVMKPGGSIESASPRLRVAVPGRDTTAFLVLTIMLGPEAIDPVEMPFHQVARAVAQGWCDAGLLIHEAQLTHQRMGLVPVADLGVFWHDHTGLPLPLGLNVVRRDLDERLGPGTLHRVADALRASVRYAIDHPDQSRAFLLAHADDRPEWRDPALLDRYLAMYANRTAIDMGARGVNALQRLFEEAHAAGLCPSVPPVDVI